MLLSCINNRAVSHPATHGIHTTTSQKAFNSRVGHTKCFQHARGNHRNRVSDTGRDGLWPELNKVLLILSVIQEPLERSVRGGKKLSGGVLHASVCVPCRCLEKMLQRVEHFLNTGKHELSILMNPLELFTLQQHATDSKSALIHFVTLWHFASWYFRKQGKPQDNLQYPRCPEFIVIYQKNGSVFLRHVCDW